MNSKRVALCLLDEDGNILSQAALRVKWSKELEENLSVCHGINAEDCINATIAEEIKKQITPELLSELINEKENITENRNWKPGEGFTDEGSCNCTRLDS